MSKQTYKVSLTVDHMRVIIEAIEAFNRAQMGQFDIWLEKVFLSQINDPYFKKFVSDSVLKWDKRKDINQTLRRAIFKHELLANSTSSGAGLTNLSQDAKLGHEIYEALNQFVSVQDNDGWWGFFHNFDDPAKWSGTDDPLPEIEGFVKHKDFPIKNQKEIKEAVEKEDYRRAWEIANEEIGEKIRHEGKEIQKTRDGTYFVRITKPRKKD